MRKFNTYETNLLLRFGFDPFNLATKIDLDIPVEYIVKKAFFFNREFFVNENVLIPRIESEELVKIAVDKVKKDRFVEFADIGSGSGVIGLSFALELEKLGIGYDAYLSDISTEALKVTKENLDTLFSSKNLNCFTNKTLNDNKIKIIKSDLFKNYPKKRKFDIIFANLPYIPTKRIATLENSVKYFEPKLALDGGLDGLEIIKNFLKNIKDRLKPNALVLMEVDDSHTEKTIKNLSFDSLTIKTLKDLNGKNRYWIAESI